MGEELFSSDPVSYKMDRRSPEAFALRDAVNRKLYDFMGNYTDKVLAEYIVVLVCNDKHQNQARNDLEAFLGDDSGKFVAWLWDHLAKENYASRTLMDSSTLKAEVAYSQEDVSNKQQKSSSLPDHHINASGMSDIPLPKDGRYDPPYYSTNSNCSKVIEISESVLRRRPSVNDALPEENNEILQAHLNEVNAERLQAEPMIVNKTSGAADHSGATKHFSSIVRCSPSGDEQLPDEYQHQKIAKTDSSALLHRPLPVPRTEPVARGLRSIITEDQQPRPAPMRNSAKIRLLSAAVDSAPHQITRPRGNVWDRLGKPSADDYAENRGKKNLHDNNLIKRGLPECQGEELQNPRSMRVKQNARLSSDFVEESVGLGSRKLEHSSNNTVDFSHVNNSKRKRLYSESNSGNSPSFSGYKENKQVKEVLPKTSDSFPLKFNRSQSFSKVASDVKHSPMSISESTSIPRRVEQNSQADKVDSVVSANVMRNSRPDKPSSPQLNKIASVTSQTQKQVPKNSQLSYKSETPSKAQNHSANRRPVKEGVVDVKSKLHQIESEVLDAKSKLRLKLAEMKTDAKPSALTGVQNHSEEDLESRTVLVTNVHFAATREPLLSHFTKCGPVAKVVMLTDTITAQPKGAAYIVFANKESVEKAISMSGTSFFSRILTVMRKADMPPDFLVPSPSAWKSVQPLYPQPSWKGSGHYTSSHLQWRRHNPANRDNSMSATTNGMESSTTGE